MGLRELQGDPRNPLEPLESPLTTTPEVDSEIKAR